MFKLDELEIKAQIFANEPFPTTFAFIGRTRIGYEFVSEEGVAMVFGSKEQFEEFFRESRIDILSDGDERRIPNEFAESYLFMLESMKNMEKNFSNYGIK